ncbi:heterokaryon incompatibility protein-domain-containing protein [Podospora fimiseda]|uniref:Heterokaryon incompatibility protein-domain-containing protein n=1 Tax=Podospora fimiseda TaxID=252190 RepID=A0AAN6YM79_9PEZI|nr:heterokaryon incompatibility protein-domain-containing protein [Podospora fimiseda]
MSDTEHSHYPACYRTLAPGQIRVFELEPGDPSAPIVGGLVPQSIDGEPYEAVSYVWGNQRDRRELVVSGSRLSVTVNLHGALTAFRHPKSTGEKRRLWADALCINQEDLPERTSQLELMGRIFAQAHRVLSWLGWDEGEEGQRHTLAAIRFIRDFMEDPDAGILEARILLHHDPNVLGTVDPTLPPLSDEDQLRFEDQARKWKSVKVFFGIEYFHRTWIVQELGLARKAIISAAPTPSDNQALELDVIDWPLVGSFVKFLDYSGASLVTHLDLRSWVTHHILMVWETNDDGTPACDFLTGMHWARILGVTDPRDRVYSLLGHPYAVVDGELIVKPDYTISCGVLYTKLAANFIRKTKKLDAVKLVDHEVDPCLEMRVWDPGDEGIMPSWAPDWHSINRTTPLDYPIDAADAEDDWIRIEGDTNGTPGKPLPQLIVRGWVIDEISAVSHRMETTDFPVTNVAREKAKEHPFWLNRVWEVAFPTNGPPDRDALAVLESLSLALSFGIRDADEKVSKAGLNQTLEDHHRSFAAYVLQYHKLWSDANEAGDRGGYLPVSSMFDRLPAKVQRVLRLRAAGASSAGFLECMTWPSMCRVVYRTASGLVGMGSRISRPGDIVCRLRGSDELMTLRRVKGGSQNAPIPCAFVGPTVVPSRVKKGVLDGGAFGDEPAMFRVI